MAATMVRELLSRANLSDFLGSFAAQALHIAEDLRDRWERTCREAVERKRVPDLHAARDEYHAELLTHLHAFRSYLDLSRLHQKKHGFNPIAVQQLVDADEKVRTLYNELFPRWQSLDDLHRIIIEKMSPSAERANELAAKYPPPQSWYEETVDPFAPDVENASNQLKGGR